MKIEIFRFNLRLRKLKYAKVHPMKTESKIELKKYPTDRNLFKKKVFMLDDLEIDDLIKIATNEATWLIQNEK